MSNRNGLLAPQATHGNPEVSYYLMKGEPIPAPTLVEPVSIFAQDSTTNATLFVDGLAAGAYQGAINIVPGENTTAASAGAGITIRTVAGTGAGNAATTVEVGTNSQGPNNLFIAGLSGVGQVYDEVYNQPVSLQPLTMVQTNANLTPANPEECLRGAQAAIAAAIATPGSQFNVFRVPRTGAYTIQTEISIGNNVPSNSVVIPSTLVGGVPIWSSISLGFQVQGTVQAVPYASFEVLGGDFYGDQAFAGNSVITKTYTSVAILQAGVSYAVTLNCAAGWNIGTAGQIKTELVAMC